MQETMQTEVMRSTVRWYGRPPHLPSGPCPLSWGIRGCCLNRARTVRPFAYSVSGRSTLPESELPWLVAGLPVYYHRSNGDRVSATVVDPSSRGGRRVSIRYELGGEEVLYEHAPEERLEFAIVTAESPDSPQPVHHEAPMDTLL